MAHVVSCGIQSLETGKNIRFVRLLAGLLLMCGIATAQPARLLDRDFSIDQPARKLGLSQRAVNCMIQDKEGYLWIGTWTGLIRYDGYSTVVYRTDKAPHKLKSDLISALFEDSQGYIWIGTQMEGLFRFDKRTHQFDQYKNVPRKPNTLSNNRVLAITEDGAGRLWVATEDGLNVLDIGREQFQVFRHDPNMPSSLVNNKVSDVYYSSHQDALWVATGDGLSVLTGVTNNIGAFQNLMCTTEQYYTSNYYIKIGETVSHNKSTIWIASSAGLKRYADGKLENFMIENRPAGYNTFLSIQAVSGDHPFVMVGSEHGVSFFDATTSRFSKFVSGESNLSQASVSSLFIDAGGVLWMGTKKGLNKADSYAYDFMAFKTETFAGGSTIISGLRAASNSGYWIATLGSGLFKLDDKDHFKAVEFDKNHQFSRGNFIQVMLVDRRGMVSLGTAGEGVIRFKESDYDATTGTVRQSTVYSTTTTERLSADYISALAEDNAGSLWVGTFHGGLSKISPEGKATIYRDSLLMSSSFNVMHVDRAGALWVGTSGNGLFKVREWPDRLDIKHYHRDDQYKGGLPNNFVNSIFEDHTGLLWVSTGDGLYSFDPRSEVFTSHLLQDHPNYEVIAGIQEDRYGKIWLAHAQGLTVIDPADSTYKKDFDHHDRIMGGFYFCNASGRDAQGKLLFAGSDGFNIIDFDTAHHVPPMPRVQITDIQLFGKSIGAVDGKSVLKESLGEASDLRLRHNQNSISFEFATLDFAAPDKVKYAYKLEGFDRQWHYTSADRRLAVYTNLPTGDYAFKVKSSNRDGSWSGVVREMQIVVLPPWWSTYWAMAIYALLAVGILYAFRKFILMRANFRHQVEREHQEAIRLQELDRIKTKFFTNISHEFRTPISLIVSPLDRMQRKYKDQEFQREIALIDRNAKRLLNLVNQLLDFRKLESDDIRMKATEGDIVEFIKDAVTSFSDLSEKKHIRLEFSTQVPQLTTYFDKDILEKILFNLLSNAFKFTLEDGKVNVDLTIDRKPGGSHLIITVKDTGIGIAADMHERIFERFFQSELPRTVVNPGSGIGLALTKEFVKIHGGRISVESVLGRGSSFIVEIPVVEEAVSSLVAEPGIVAPDMDTVAEADGDDEKPVVMVVEDNDDFRFYLKDNLKQHFRIIEAPDGEQGWELCLRELPNLIVSDVLMPNLNGLELCSRIKNDSRTSHIPVILLTARSTEAQRLEGFEHGADEYIAKPFNYEILKSRIQYLIALRSKFQQAFQHQIPVKASELKIMPLDEKFVKDAVAIVEENLSNPDFSVEDLRARLLISRTLLFKKVISLTGKSPLEFIRTIRMQTAAQLLEKSQLIVSEVAYKVGFNNPKYFARQFKEIYGILPSEYRASKRESSNKTAASQPSATGAVALAKQSKPQS